MWPKKEKDHRPSNYKFVSPSSMTMAEPGLKTRTTQELRRLQSSRPPSWTLPKLSATQVMSTLERSRLSLWSTMASTCPTLASWHLNRTRRWATTHKPRWQLRNTSRLYRSKSLLLTKRQSMLPSSRSLKRRLRSLSHLCRQATMVPQLI